MRATGGSCLRPRHQLIDSSCAAVTLIWLFFHGVELLTEHQRRLMSQHDQLNRYILKMNVPPDLRTKLREYFVHYQNAFDSFNESSLISETPEEEQAHLRNLVDELFEQHHELYRGCAPTGQ